MGQGLTGDVVNVGAGLLAGMGDPAMAVGGSVIGMGLKAGGLIPKSLLASTAAEDTLFKSMGRGAIEGGTVAAMMEPATMLRDSMYQQDHSLTDSLHNVGMGVVFGSALEGLKYGGRRLGDYMSGGPEKGPAVGADSPEVADKIRAIEQVSAQMSEGKRPTLEPLHDHAELERSGEGPRPPGSEHLAYEHEPVNTDAPVTKQYYLGTEGGNESLHGAADVRNSSTDFGPGLYGSDKLASENGIAASDFNEGGPGLVHQFETQEAKLFDTEKPLDQATASLLSESVKDQEPHLAKELAKGEISLRQFYDSAGEEGKKAMSTALSASGYDGLHYTETDAGAKRNGVMMFPDKAENVRQTGEPYAANPDVKGGLTPEEASARLKDYGSRENDLLHSQSEVEANKALNDRATSKEVNPEDDSFVQQEHEAALKQALAASEKGNLSKSDQAILDEIQGKAGESEVPTLSQRKKLGSDTLQAMANCIVEH